MNCKTNHLHLSRKMMVDISLSPSRFTIIICIPIKVMMIFALWFRTMALHHAGSPSRSIAKDISRKTKVKNYALPSIFASNFQNRQCSLTQVLPFSLKSDALSSAYERRINWGLLCQDRPQLGDDLAEGILNCQRWSLLFWCQMVKE